MPRRIPVSYTHLDVYKRQMSGKVQYEALNTGNIIKDTIYTDNVEFIILVESNNVEGFVKSIVNLTSDKAEIVVGEEEYLDTVIE